MMHTYFRFQGNFRCLKLLLNKGANWKEKDNEGQTAMHLSTRHKSNKCLALLMKQLEMAEIDDQDKNKVQLKTSWYLQLLKRFVFISPISAMPKQSCCITARCA